MKSVSLPIAFLILSKLTLLGNGGAWQTGVPATGSARATNNGRHTDVTIENETLKIDLHPEYAVVDVHYRMHNTEAKVRQDFFFPVERWAKNPDADIDAKSADIGHYEITVDGKKLPWTNVSGPKKESSETKEVDSKPNQENSEARQEATSEASQESSGDEEEGETTSGSFWQQSISTINSWKKSVIPFERNQTREVRIRYGVRYAENDESVSDDSHMSDATFAYSLSPAATWKGPIGKGKIEINILHPEPEDVSIEKPKERFRKVSDTYYEWNFQNLKPTLADDIRIVAHSKYDSYPTGYSEEDVRRHASYIIRSNQYFLDHTDYDATASSTLAQQDKHNYDVVNIKNDPQRELQTPWAEGAKDDGIGESVTLDVKRPLPLYGILIRPGYYDVDREDIWWANNRVASLEVTLNDEHTFTENIPDERFENPYLIRVRNYAKPVNKMKLTINSVHRGKLTRDTCVSLVELRAALAKKPEVHGAR